MNFDDYLRDRRELIRQQVGPFTPLERSTVEYNEQATSYFKEQRALIVKQSKYTTTIMWASIIMALATVVIAIVGYLQYTQSSKMVEEYGRSQAPTLQVPPHKQ